MILVYRLVNNNVGIDFKNLLRLLSLLPEVTFTNCINQVLQQGKGVIFFSIRVIND